LYIKKKTNNKKQFYVLKFLFITDITLLGINIGLFGYGINLGLIGVCLCVKNWRYKFVGFGD
jgi:hypothetical protein